MAARTREDFIALLERTHDAAWLDGLRSQPDSNALLEGILAEAVLISRVVDDGCNAAAISGAPGARSGVCLLTLSRSITVESFTVPAGQLFLVNGIQYQTTIPVFVAVGPDTFILPLETLRKTEAVNTFGRGAFPMGAEGSSISDPTAGTVLDTGGNVILAAPPTPTITNVVGSTDTILGTTDWLLALGQERGQQRAPNEADEEYRLRVRNIPDAVGPHGVASAVNGVGQQGELPPITLREPFDDKSSAALDQNIGLGSFNPMFWWDDRTTQAPPTPYDSPAPYLDAGLLPFPLNPGTALVPYAVTFDDANGLSGVIALLLSTREVTAYFLLQTNFAPNDPDNPDTTPPGGPYFDRLVWLSNGKLDEFDSPRLLAALLAVWEEANRKRAGGVQFDLELPEASNYLAQGSTIVAGPSVVWTLVPPPGKQWFFESLVVGKYGTPAQFLQPHFVRFTFSDLSTFDTPIYYDVDSEMITREDIVIPVDRVIQIEGFTEGDGINTGHLSGFLRAAEVTV